MQAPDAHPAAAAPLQAGPTTNDDDSTPLPTLPNASSIKRLRTQGPIEAMKWTTRRPDVDEAALHAAAAVYARAARFSSDAERRRVAGIRLAECLLTWPKLITHEEACDAACSAATRYPPISTLEARTVPYPILDALDSRIPDAYPIPDACLFLSHNEIPAPTPASAPRATRARRRCPLQALWPRSVCTVTPLLRQAPLQVRTWKV